MNQETETESNSLRDALESSWDAIESGQTDGAKDDGIIPELDTPQAETATPVSPEVSKTESPGDTRGDRDDKGRFRKKELEAAAAKEGKAPEVKTEAATPAPEAGDPIVAPISWKKEEQEAFRSLPRPVQETIARREKEREIAWNRGQMEVANFRKKYSSIEEALAPHSNKWARLGVEPGQVIKQFLAWQERLDQDPKSGIAELAATYGLDPSAIAQHAPTVDPQISSLQAEIQRLKTEVMGRSQYEEQAYMSEISNSIGAYAMEKGQDGKPLRPYFNDLYHDMLPIADSLKRANPNATPTQIIDAAYDRAVYANPSTRAAMLEERSKQEEAKRIAEAKDRTTRAKLASSTLTNGTPGTLTNGGPKTIRESLLQTWDELT
jgi:hypothetical protein